ALTLTRARNSVRTVSRFPPLTASIRRGSDGAALKPAHAESTSTTVVARPFRAAIGVRRTSDLHTVRADPELVDLDTELVRDAEHHVCVRAMCRRHDVAIAFQQSPGDQERERIGRVDVAVTHAAAIEDHRV